jgi:adenosylcobinamide-GDP ribazoletransferase
LVAAARYLTIVPIPGRPYGGSEELGAAAPWFPIVGLGIGVVLVVTDTLITMVFPALVAALLTVTLWKTLTGGLHLDGLADCLDGLAGRDPAHRLAVMRDSCIGVFGALGLILFLLLKIGAVAELTPGGRWPVLLAAPAIGRAMPPLVALVFPAARSEGHGAEFRLGLGVGSAILGLVVTTVVGFAVLGPIGIIALAAATLVTFGVGGFMTRRLGGMTGDVLGASVEVAELAALLTVLGWNHTRLA